MRFVRLRILALLAVVLLAACGKSTVRPGPAAPGFSVASLRGDTVALMASRQVSMQGFEETVADAFGGGDSLAAYLAARILDSLGRGTPPFTAVLADSALAARFQDTAATNLPAPDGPTHVLRVRDLKVERYLNEVPSTLLPSGEGGVMQPAGGGTSEGCRVSFDVEIWAANTTGFERRYVFSVTGQANVLLHARESALREALRVAANRAAWHLHGN